MCDVSSVRGVARPGGFGAGRSSAPKLRVARGAILIDADAVARELQRPDGAGFQPIVDRFGLGVVGGDGELDRPGIAAVVFADAERVDAGLLGEHRLGDDIAKRPGVRMLISLCVKGDVAEGVETELHILAIVSAPRVNRLDSSTFKGEL